MSPAEIASALKLRLAAELIEDRRALARRSLAIADACVATKDPRTERMRASALAFEIDRWYTALEAVLERALRALDGDVPSGPNWHRELLRAASVPIAGGRPEIIPQPSLPELQELLRLRHFVRHAYDSEPDLARLQLHAQQALAAESAISASLTALDTWLRSAT